jgi:hypothetical protein
MVPFVFVIDDFLLNPEGVRSRALELTYELQGNYPGLNSVEKLHIQGLEQAVSAIVREQVSAPWGPESTHGSCRVALASDDRPGRIHIDQSHWSGILYLSRPEDCRGGTEFYRHLPTGTDRAPMDLDSVKQLGFSSYDAMKEEILEKDAFDRSKWELTMTVPMRYNRLILLQPHYWHTSGPGFGDSIENGRLIYVLFFLRGQRSGSAPPPARQASPGQG